jgi:glyoxylase-like metal-dependent hydrolase (beta-lactamase superfamily II)
MNQITQAKQILKIILPTPFPVGDVNVYLIKGERLTLVDAGPKTEEAWLSFQQQLKEYGYTPDDIEQIIITHHHPDHVGMLDYFDHNIPVFGHPFNKPWLKKDERFLQAQARYFEQLFLTFGLGENFLPSIQKLNNTLEYSCDRELHHDLIEGMEIDGLSGWIVMETPGHAQSHIVLYEEKTGILVGGDLLLKDISPNPLLEPPMIEGVTDRPRPQLQLNNSISKLLDLSISVVYPGHGENIENVHELIAYRLKKQAERAELVKGFLQEKPLTAFEVCKALFPTIYHKQLMLTMSETVGQLDYLEDNRQIRIDEINTPALYYVVEK